MTDLCEFFVNCRPNEVAQKLATIYGIDGYVHEHKDLKEEIDKLFSIHNVPKAMGEEIRKNLIVRLGFAWNGGQGNIVGIVYSTKENPNVSIVNYFEPSNKQIPKINLDTAISLGLDVHQ
jgi:hypothetical protein